MNSGAFFVPLSGIFFGSPVNRIVALAHSLKINSAIGL